jgi:anti-anti-sigma regulatory factor
MTLAIGKKPAKPRARAPARKPVAASRHVLAMAPARVEAVVPSPAEPEVAAAVPLVEALLPQSPANPVDATASASPDPAPDAVIHLGAHLTLREAVALRAELSDRVDLVDAVGLDASGVQKVDTAGLQVLLAFTRQRRAAQAATVWTGCSDSVRKAAASLDLARALDLPAGAAS